MKYNKIYFEAVNNESNQFNLLINKNHKKLRVTNNQFKIIVNDSNTLLIGWDNIKEYRFIKDNVKYCNAKYLDLSKAYSSIVQHTLTQYSIHEFTDFKGSVLDKMKAIDNKYKLTELVLSL